jgi:hypothetical protein
VAVAVVLLLFPPYAVELPNGARMYHAFGFLLTGSFGGVSDSAVVNVGLLAVLELVAAAIAAVLFFVNKTNHPPKQGAS